MGNSARCAAWRLLSDRNRLVLTRRSKSNERPHTYANAAAESVVQNIVILSALPRPVQASFDLCAGARSLLQRWIIPSNHCRATTKRSVSLGFCSICCSLLVSPSPLSLPLSLSLLFHFLFLIPTLSFFLSPSFAMIRWIISFGKRW